MSDKKVKDLEYWEGEDEDSFGDFVASFLYYEREPSVNIELGDDDGHGEYWLNGKQIVELRDWLNECIRVQEKEI